DRRKLCETRRARAQKEGCTNWRGPLHSCNYRLKPSGTVRALWGCTVPSFPFARRPWCPECLSGAETVAPLPARSACPDSVVDLVGGLPFAGLVSLFTSAGSSA